AQAGRKAGAGRGTRPEGATAPEGADRYANDKRLRRADAGAASAIGARGASGTSLHQASGVTDAVRCVMPSGTLPVASETVAARARAWCPRGHCSFARTVTIRYIAARKVYPYAPRANKHSAGAVRKCEAYANGSIECCI
ncbi:MAG: hypothetical protein ACYSPI_12540, partial [Planctomycetota bacterium]